VGPCAHPWSGGCSSFPSRGDIGVQGRSRSPPPKINKADAPRVRSAVHPRLCPLVLSSASDPPVFRACRSPLVRDLLSCATVSILRRKDGVFQPSALTQNGVAGPEPLGAAAFTAGDGLRALRREQRGPRVGEGKDGLGWWTCPGTERRARLWHGRQITPCEASTSPPVLLRSAVWEDPPSRHGAGSCCPKCRMRTQNQTQEFFCGQTKPLPPKKA